MGKFLEWVFFVILVGDNLIDFVFLFFDVVELIKIIGMEYGVNFVKVDCNGFGRNNLFYIFLILF